MNEPRFLMVPGLGLTAEDWVPTIRSLITRGVDPAQLEVALLPGYGEPLKAGEPVDPQVAARMLLDTSLRPGQRHVPLGHSSSCQVVVHAAVLAPEEVVGLILVGPTTDPRAATWPRLILRWLATAAHETPRLVPSLVRQYRTTGLHHMLRVMDAARRDRIDRTLRDVRCPVRVIRGRHDRIAPEDWCTGLAPSVTLPRCGHMVTITDGDLVAREVQHSGETPAGAP